MKRIVGRVDITCDPMPILIDRRGATIKAARESGLFSAFNIAHDGAIMQHPLRECRIAINGGGVIWRDERAKNDLLDFLGGQLTSCAANIVSYRQLAYYYFDGEPDFALNGELDVRWRPVGPP